MGRNVHQKTISGTIIDSKNIFTADAGRGEAILGKRCFSDNKMLTGGGSSSSYVTAPLERGAAVDRRKQRETSDYLKRARELDRQIPRHQPDEEGPFKREVKYYGDKGRVLIPVVGAFVEVSSDSHAIAELCTSLQADQYCANHRSQPATHLPHQGGEDALGMGPDPSRPLLGPRDQPGSQTAQSSQKQE